MRRPGPGQPEEDQEADDPTLIRVPDPDEEDAGEPEDEETGKDANPESDPD
jgi:hypothetical protein